MKILITSGGTTEKIDDVRGITNHSTGYLGKEIAELFLAKGHQVTLVTVKTAVKPEPKENLKITEITNVDSLLKSMEPLVKEHDVLIHSMAISDYTPIYMTDFTELEDTENPSQLLHKSNTESKISSASDYQDLFKAARASLKRNQANIIVANDLGEITPNQHIAYLVDEKGEEMVTTKSAIAQALYERICYD